MMNKRVIMRERIIIVQRVSWILVLLAPQVLTKAVPVHGGVKIILVLVDTILPPLYSAVQCSPVQSNMRR